MTDAGLTSRAVLLSVPLVPPFAGVRLVMDHAPAVAEPPTLAPVRVNAPGDALWQTASGPPGVTVAGELQGFASAKREKPLREVRLAMGSDPATWVPLRVHAPPPSGRLMILTVASGTPPEVKSVPVISRA